MATSLTSAQAEALLLQTDTSSRRSIYLAWCQLGASRREIVPLIASAYSRTRETRGRESQIHHATPFARFDQGAVELGLRGLRDPRREVRYRACGLLAHSGRAETVSDLAGLQRGASSAPARRAIAALQNGEPFGPDDDPIYFFYGDEPYRAPRGTFAVRLEAAVGGWLEQKGFHPTYCFQHRFEYRNANRVLRAEWDSYDVEARIRVTSLGGQELAQETLRADAANVTGIATAIQNRLPPFDPPQ